MRVSRSLSDCNPELAEKALLVQETFIRRFSPWLLLITCTQRPQAIQDALYQQGRATLPQVNAVRATVGLPPITAAENKPVTWVTHSKHTKEPAEAVDFVVALDPDGDGPVKPVLEWEDEARYRAMGEIAEGLGLVWGGRWKKPDFCHVEVPT